MLESVYIHGALVYVSAYCVAVYNDVRYSGQIHYKYKVEL
jgi:hypothetical protein